MGGKERLSRRDFLRVTGYTVIGVLTIGSTELTPKDPSELIKVSSKATRVTLETVEVEVQANPVGFYEGLRDVAMYDFGFKGLNELEIYLQRSPLKIEFATRLPNNKQMTHIPSFIPSGSRIKIHESFLEGYILRDKDPVNRVLADRDVYHELVHVWQEVRNPQDYAREFFRANSILSKNSPYQRYEIEADQLAGKVVTDKIKHGQHNQGRLQKFFNFKKVN